MPVPGLSLLGLKRIRGFVSILHNINPTIIIIIIRSELSEFSVYLKKFDCRKITKTWKLIKFEKKG